MAQQPPLDPPALPPPTHGSRGRLPLPRRRRPAHSSLPPSVAGHARQPPTPPDDVDWASQVVGTIDQYVGLVRDRADPAGSGRHPRRRLRRSSS